MGFEKGGKGRKRPISRKGGQTPLRRKKRLLLRRTQEGCGGLGGENPAAFPQARPIFQQPFSLLENAQTLAGIAFRAAGKSANNFSSSVEVCPKTLPARNFGQPQPSRVF